MEDHGHADLGQLADAALRERHGSNGRRMQRTTIKGDYGLGYFENDDQRRYEELEQTV